MSFFSGRYNQKKQEAEDKRVEAMPKQKTHKGTKKRFRVTAKGKVKHRRSGTSHLQVRVSAKRKRNLRGTGVLDKSDTPNIIEALASNSY